METAEPKLRDGQIFIIVDASWSTEEVARQFEVFAARGLRFDPRKPLTALGAKLLAISNAWRHR